ncbi:MAG TPA: hypothetical protein VFK05_03970 [Polyangiaceae bacterium]|nr:hypothetical protein [Polyangiaceae bacterium]
MCKFSASSSALATKPAEALIRLVMCALPAVTLMQQGVAMSAVAALFLGFIDGYARRWGAYTSRSFVADSEGLKIAFGFHAEVIPWGSVLGIQTWHHFNRIDYVAVHHLRAGRIDVATCVSRYAEDELRAFVHACADHVRAGASRPRMTVAGLSERCVYLPLLRRLVEDVALAVLVGTVIGAVGWSFLFGLLAASQSAVVAAARYTVRTTRFVQKNGLWLVDGLESRPLRAIPRALRLWVRCLDAVTASDSFGS